MSQQIDAAAAVLFIEDAAGKPCGTGFAVEHPEQEPPWVVTCAHVVEECGGIAQLRVRYGGEAQPLEATLVADRYDRDIDLALLRVPGLLPSMPKLKPVLDGKKADAIVVTGFGYRNRKQGAEPIVGVLGAQSTQIGPHRCNYWPLEFPHGSRFAKGYSGSPVTREGTLEVLGVATDALADGSAGYAADIASLKLIYGDSLPDDFLQPGYLLPWEQRQTLKTLVEELGVDKEKLRLMAHFALHVDVTDGVPDDNPPDLIDWLAGWGERNDWSPLLSVVRQLYENAIEDVYRVRLASWLDEAAAYLDIDDIWQRSVVNLEPSATEAGVPKALLVTLGDITFGEGTNTPSHQRDVRFFYHRWGRTVPAGSADSGRFRLHHSALDRHQAARMEQRDVAEHIRQLRLTCLPQVTDAATHFVLPDELLNAPVEQWVVRSGPVGREVEVPLGALSPVVVRPGSRQQLRDRDEAMGTWHEWWNCQKSHANKTVSETLDWLENPRRLWLLNLARRGKVCIAFGFVPSTEDCLLDMIEGGISLAIWCRRKVAFDALKSFLLQRIGETPICQLPNTLWDLRAELMEEFEGDELEALFQEPCFNLSLLYDDPSCRLPLSRAQSDDNSRFYPGVDA